jgi:hypothetical protein
MLGNAMKRFTLGAVILALLATPVYAQKRKAAPEATPEELQKKRDAETVDRNYNSALKRMEQPGSAGRTDPWSNMRGPSEGKR